jgi:hypothetical protein
METVVRKTNEEIANVVRGALDDTFDNMRIINVKVAKEVDSDDNEILRIFVIFEGTPKRGDFKKLSGVVRLTRPKLAEIGEKAFPIFSFVSKGEIGARLAPA